MSKMARNMVKLIFVSLVFGMSSAAFVDTLFKCSKTDNACHTKLLQSSLNKIGESGIPEFDIGPTDPIHLQNISVSVLNMVNITLIDGVAKGIKDCIIDEFTNDFDKLTSKLRIICNIVIKGHYKVEGASPLIETVLGGSEVHGEGTAKVKIDKLVIEFDIPFRAKKHDDGEIYLISVVNKIQKTFDVQGKVTFGADKLFVGKQDVSEMIIKYLNENWKFVMKSFGEPFYNKATDICFNITRNFFNQVPAKYYISEDLTQYLAN